MGDNINNPSHYNIGKLEVIEVLEDWKLSFHLGNAMKYIARAGKKKPDKYSEDLEKAIWYLRRAIELELKKSQAKIISNSNCDGVLTIDNNLINSDTRITIHGS